MNNIITFVPNHEVFLFFFLFCSFQQQEHAENTVKMLRQCLSPAEKASLPNTQAATSVAAVGEIRTEGSGQSVVFELQIAIVMT